MHGLSAKGCTVLFPPYLPLRSCQEGKTYKIRCFCCSWQCLQARKIHIKFVVFVVPGNACKPETDKRSCFRCFWQCLQARSILILLFSLLLAVFASPKHIQIVVSLFLAVFASPKHIKCVVFVVPARVCKPETYKNSRLCCSW